MKKFMLAFMAVACMATFSVSAARAEEAMTAPTTKTEAPVKAEVSKEVKKEKHHSKKEKHHAKKVKAEKTTKVESEAKTTEAQ